MNWIEFVHTKMNDKSLEWLRKVRVGYWWKDMLVRGPNWFVCIISKTLIWPIHYVTSHNTTMNTRTHCLRNSHKNTALKRIVTIHHSKNHHSQFISHEISFTLSCWPSFCMNHKLAHSRNNEYLYCISRSTNVFRNTFNKIKQ